MSRFCTPVDDDTIDDLCVFVLDVLLFEQRMDAGSPQSCRCLIPNIYKNLKERKIFSEHKTGPQSQKA